MLLLWLFRIVVSSVQGRIMHVAGYSLVLGLLQCSFVGLKAWVSQYL
jgi:hypothetical protein